MKKLLGINECKMDTHFGSFNLKCFNFGPREQDNVLVLSKPTNSMPVVRIQSACFTAEIFRSKDCDCHEQLESSLKKVQAEGGAVIYLLQDGRGAGIFAKIAGLHLTQSQGLDTAAAYEHLGIHPDPRNYEQVIEVIEILGFKELRLLTNNPRKIQPLQDYGFKVTREPLEIEPTDGSRAYLTSKKEKLGHLFSRYI